LLPITGGGKAAPLISRHPGQFPCFPRTIFSTPMLGPSIQLLYDVFIGRDPHTFFLAPRWPFPSLDLIAALFFPSREPANFSPVIPFDKSPAFFLCSPQKPSVMGVMIQLFTSTLSCHFSCLKFQFFFRECPFAKHKHDQVLFFCSP